MAGGTAVVVATGTALGAAMGAAATNGYVRDDGSFKIAKLRDGDGSPVLLASGFLTERDDGWGSWRRMIDERYGESPVYRVHWGSKELKAIGRLLAAGGGKVLGARILAKGAARGSYKAAGRVPYLGPIALVHELATNPWSMALSRSAKTGGALADILSRTDVDTFVLVGHSLGARVMLVAAESLATRPGAPKLEAVHLLGAAIPSKRDWRALNDSVSHRVWNYHSDNDPVLRYLYRGVQMGRRPAGVHGVQTSFARIRNADVTASVASHSGYFDNVNLR